MNHLPELIRPAKKVDSQSIYEIINDASMAYEGVIPPDRWHEPYMSMEELLDQQSQGVVFHCFLVGEKIMGVMGIQDKGEVTLIRHAYVRTQARGKGIGGRLLTHLEKSTTKPILIGTWQAASWAIGFYQKHGFKLVENPSFLLRRFWNIPKRQIESSVVLANERWLGKD